MPRGDGTGPAGEGPGTGRGLGICGGYEEGGYARAPIRGGRWSGGNGCRGWRNTSLRRRDVWWRNQAERTEIQETESLKRQVYAVEELISRLGDRIEVLLRNRGKK